MELIRLAVARPPAINDRWSRETTAAHTLTNLWPESSLPRTFGKKPDTGGRDCRKMATFIRRLFFDLYDAAGITLKLDYKQTIIFL